MSNLNKYKKELLQLILSADKDKADGMNVFELAELKGRKDAIIELLDKVEKL